MMRRDSNRSAILFVARGDDVPAVLGRVNELLAFRRRLGGHGEDVLAVVVGAEAHACLDGGISVTQPCSSDDPVLEEVESVHGIWTLLWFRMDATKDVDVGTRRATLVRHVRRRTSPSAETRPPHILVLPVETPREQARRTSTSWEVPEDLVACETRSKGFVVDSLSRDIVAA
ncbi:MAG: hypothetical protein U0169_24950 [Polyangiaceae bacterium]